MQDLTKMIAANSGYSRQVSHVPWLTKDRFWNFVFWFGMSSGLAASFALSGIHNSLQQFSYWSSLVFWISVLGVPLLVRYFCKTTFVKDTIFLTSEGKEFDVAQNLPDKSLTFIATLVLTAFTGMILDNKLLYISDAASTYTIVTVFFGIPTLFFIFKNCPISILFNYNFWKLDLGQGSCVNRSRNHYASSSRSKSSDYITNPAYSNPSCRLIQTLNTRQ